MLKQKSGRVDVAQGTLKIYLDESLLTRHGNKERKDRQMGGAGPIHWPSWDVYMCQTLPM
jgi:hypothetical protein